MGPQFKLWKIKSCVVQNAVTMDIFQEHELGHNPESTTYPILAPNDELN